MADALTPGLARVRVDAARGDGADARDDVVAIEAPLALVIDDAPFAVLMRTPTGADDDLALAAGFLASEGIIEDRDDLAALAPCPSDANQVRVRLATGVAPPPAARPTAMTSACGVCGTRTVQEVLRRLPTRAARPAAAAPSAEVIAALADLVRPHQALFRATGAVHAAALFRGAELVLVREDVGRHNATDKVLGRMLLAGRWPLEGHTLWVSGRVAFEIVQKALVASVGLVVGVGGPTSLAVELARSAGLGLVAFARGDRANRYS